MDFAREMGLDPNVIEKDYVLDWLLAGISNHPEDCFYLRYFHWRSEELRHRRGTHLILFEKEGHSEWNCQNLRRPARDNLEKPQPDCCSKVAEMMGANSGGISFFSKSVCV